MVTSPSTAKSPKVAELCRQKNVRGTSALGWLLRWFIRSFILMRLRCGTRAAVEQREVLARFMLIEESQLLGTVVVLHSQLIQHVPAQQGRQVVSDAGIFWLGYTDCDVKCLGALIGTQYHG